MEDKNFKTAEGSCIISEEVIATIARSAALEVAGVARMAARTADIQGFIGAAAGKPVRVTNTDNTMVLDVYLDLCAGARIPDVAGEGQRSVKVAVQSMTGKPVTKVNVHVEGIVFDEPKD